jgi:hypothetical protein
MQENGCAAWWKVSTSAIKVKPSKFNYTVRAEINQTNSPLGVRQGYDKTDYILISQERNK